MAISKDLKDSEREAGSLVRCWHRAVRPKVLIAFFALKAVGEIMLTEGFENTISIYYSILFLCFVD